MITKSWQDVVVDATVAPPAGPPPSWSAHANMGYTCGSSEYKGTAKMKTDSPSGCEDAAKAMESQGVNFAIYPGNHNCYVCSVSGDIAAKLSPKPSATSFIGTGITRPPSVSAQLSTSGATLVVRVVNRGLTPEVTTIAVSGFVAAKASAVVLSSMDLNAENTAAEVDNVAPVAHSGAGAPVISSDAHGGVLVTMTVPAYSYTIATLLN